MSVFCAANENANRKKHLAAIVIHRAYVRSDFPSPPFSPPVKSLFKSLQESQSSRKPQSIPCETKIKMCVYDGGEFKSSQPRRAITITATIQSVAIHTIEHNIDSLTHCIGSHRSSEKTKQKLVNCHSYAVHV